MKPEAMRWCIFRLTSDKERGLDLLNLTGTHPINFYFVTLSDGFEAFEKAQLGDKWESRIRQKVIGIKQDVSI